MIVAILTTYGMEDIAYSINTETSASTMISTVDILNIQSLLSGIFSRRRLLKMKKKAPNLIMRKFPKLSNLS
ncbi:hypothetical protein CHH58_16630 [Terribacillus saccharophilus]|nr:hypothetical protein CHH58_16630 [Terribacillus saccharophilus]